MLRIRRLSEEPGDPEQEDGAQGVNFVDVVLKRADIKAFSCRLLRIETGGHTAYHQHTLEHIALVLQGSCKIETKEITKVVKEANIAAIPSGMPHRFFNPLNERLALLVLNLFTEETPPKEPYTEPINARATQAQFDESA